MNDPNFVKSGVNRVMGVNEATQDTTIQTDLTNPQWDPVTTLKYVGATVAQIAALTGLLWLMEILFARLDPVSPAPGRNNGHSLCILCLRNAAVSLLFAVRQYPQQWSVHLS
jgi:hypothetical protein